MGFSGSRKVNGTVTRDGEYHTLTVTLENVEGWMGTLKRIRFDYFESSSVGDIIYIKSIILK